MEPVLGSNAVVSPLDSWKPHPGGGSVAKSSKEFEAILVGQLLEKMRASFSLQGPNESDPGAKTLTGLADQALATALSARAGFGIAAVIGQALGKIER